MEGSNHGESRYWELKFKIRLLTDAHVGAGIRLFGGNVHGVRRDSDGFPYVPDTQVRGLVRLGGERLCECNPRLQDYLTTNLGARSGNAAGKWSFTAARYPQEIRKIYGLSPYLRNFSEDGILPEQAHVNVAEARLFQYQKLGAIEDKNRVLSGAVFSSEPATENDVAFIIACMRFEDRIGHRRTRGYGRICWNVESVRYYSPSNPDWNACDRDLKSWLQSLLAR